jgi:hypothetical protein
VALPYLWPEKAPTGGALTGPPQKWSCQLAIPAPKPDQWVFKVNVALSPEVCKRTPEG